MFVWNAIRRLAIRRRSRGDGVGDPTCESANDNLDDVAISGVHMDSEEDQKEIRFRMEIDERKRTVRVTSDE